MGRRGVVHVLLVEDSPSDAALCGARLEESGIAETVVVGDLASALAALKAHRFDCALVDLHLPDAHGLQAIGRVVEAAPDVAVVALTRFDSDDLGRQAVRLGAQDYLGKDDATTNRIRQALVFAIERHELRAHDLRGEVSETLQMLLEELADQVARARTLPVVDLRSPLEMVANLVQHALEELQSTTSQRVPHHAAGQMGQTADLGEVLATATRLLSPLLADRAVTIDVGAMPVVLADPQGLLEVTLHLLRHALRRSPPDTSVQITSTTHELSAVIEIHVHEAPRTTPLVTGAGASLEFCEHMVAGWGGELWTRTQTDGRTAILVRLPCAAPDRS